MTSSEKNVSLGLEIKRSTLNTHNRLNTQITSRIPLALPPFAKSPGVYLTGLVSFTHAYIAFERAWDNVCERRISPKQSGWGDDMWIDVPLDVNQSQSLPPDQSAAVMEANVVAALRTLRPHGLARSDRLRRDIATLAGILLDEVDAFLAAEISDASQGFIDHISTTVAEKPYVLIAYAYVLYMAVFSGGRWIRSVLAAPGPSFWAADLPLSSPSRSGDAANGDAKTPPSSFESSVHEKLRTFTLAQQETYESLGLSLWFWSSLSDGTDIKHEFKRRIEALESRLSPSMRDDIVKEAREIFVRCEGLVGELDELVGRQGKQLATKRGSTMANSTPMTSQRMPKSFLERAWKLSGRGWSTNWQDLSGYAGLVFILSCASCYAIYHGAVWLGPGP